MYKKIIFTFCIFNIFLLNISGVETIALYPVPKVLNQPFLELYTTDPFIQKLMKRSADVHGWLSAIYEGPWVGYVQDLDVVNGTLRPGAYIYTQPDVESLILTKYQSKDDIYLKAERNPNWLSVTLNKPVKVYCNKNVNNSIANEKGKDHNLILEKSFNGRLAVANREIKGIFYKYQLVTTDGPVYLDFKNACLSLQPQEYVDKMIYTQGMAYIIDGARILEVNVLHL